MKKLHKNKIKKKYIYIYRWMWILGLRAGDDEGGEVPIGEGAG